MMLRALTPDSGEVIFNDRGTPRRRAGARGRGAEAFRRQVQFIFQDPFGSLNPRMTVLRHHQRAAGDPRHRRRRESRREMVKELMTLVGLDVRYLRRYPHSFSGGQRQRIGIARALALRPDLLICDEPVSALDVSIQAQILNLLMDLQAQLGLTYLFISHNLAVVDYIADRIAVMCAGRIVEIAPRGVLFRNPVHPYTAGAARRGAGARSRAPARFRAADGGQGLRSRAPGRAPFRRDAEHRPELIDVGGGHFVAGQQPADAREAAPMKRMSDRVLRRRCSPVVAALLALAAPLVPRRPPTLSRDAVCSRSDVAGRQAAAGRRARCPTRCRSMARPSDAGEHGGELRHADGRAPRTPA